MLRFTRRLLSTTNNASIRTFTTKSSLAEGTVMQGLNIFKNGKDPVALKDEDYPDWLWELHQEKTLEELPEKKRLQRLRNKQIKEMNFSLKKK